ncbi:hypothetical protein MPER_08755, partial [Moniliophthora perniciosa FA553]
MEMDELLNSESERHAETEKSYNETYQKLQETTLALRLSRNELASYKAIISRKGSTDDAGANYAQAAKHALANHHKEERVFKNASTQTNCEKIAIMTSESEPANQSLTCDGTHPIGSGSAQER